MITPEEFQHMLHVLEELKQGTNRNRRLQQLQISRNANPTLLRVSATVFINLRRVTKWNIWNGKLKAPNLDDV